MMRGRCLSPSFSLLVVGLLVVLVVVVLPQAAVVQAMAVTTTATTTYLKAGNSTGRVLLNVYVVDKSEEVTLHFAEHCISEQNSMDEEFEMCTGKVIGFVDLRNINEFIDMCPVKGKELVSNIDFSVVDYWSGFLNFYQMISPWASALKFIIQLVLIWIIGTEILREVQGMDGRLEVNKQLFDLLYLKAVCVPKMLRYYARVDLGALTRSAITKPPISGRCKRIMASDQKLTTIQGIQQAAHVFLKRKKFFSIPLVIGAFFAFLDAFVQSWYFQVQYMRGALLCGDEFKVIRCRKKADQQDGLGRVHFSYQDSSRYEYGCPFES